MSVVRFVLPFLCKQVGCPWLTAFFFFNDTATTEIYTLSLHDALPILDGKRFILPLYSDGYNFSLMALSDRSEEHTSELQSPVHLVCRLLLEKKKSSCRSRRASPRTATTRASAAPCKSRTKC